MRRASSIEETTRYDSTRSLGHVSLKDAPATVLDASADSLAAAWHLAQALIAAESLGSVETALEVTVEYAKERHTFGRAIGSYQAVKHSLTEVLRQLENGRSLLYYAGWARHGSPAEFPLAAGAARSVAGRALDHAARTMISVHGGIGATWEHDAPLYFRRAQLSRRLLGGTGRRDRPGRRRAHRAGRRGLTVGWRRRPFGDPVDRRTVASSLAHVPADWRSRRSPIGTLRSVRPASLALRASGALGKALARAR